jgi:hypothetical protein
LVLLAVAVDSGVLVRERISVLNGKCKECGKVLDVSSLGGMNINIASNRGRELASSRLGVYKGINLMKSRIVKDAKAPGYDKAGSICKCVSYRNFESGRDLLRRMYNLREVSLGDGDNGRQLGELKKVKVSGGCLKLFNEIQQITNTETVMILEELLQEREDITAIDLKGIFIFRDEYDSVVDLLVEYNIVPINMPEYLIRYLNASLYVSAEGEPMSQKPVGEVNAVMYNTKELQETKVILVVGEDSPAVVDVIKAEDRELILKVNNQFNGEVLILDKRSVILV